MFHKESHASKVAFTHLVWLLGALGYRFMDCQQATPHVMRFGAAQISRRRFTKIVAAVAAMEHETDGWQTPKWWNDRTLRLEFLKKWTLRYPAGTLPQTPPGGMIPPGPPQ